MVVWQPLLLWLLRLVKEEVAEQKKKYGGEWQAGEEATERIESPQMATWIDQL